MLNGSILFLGPGRKRSSIHLHLPVASLQRRLVAWRRKYLDQVRSRAEQVCVNGPITSSICWLPGTRCIFSGISLPPSFIVCCKSEKMKPAPQSDCMIRIRSGTYCWLWTASLCCMPNPIKPGQLGLYCYRLASLLQFPTSQLWLCASCLASSGLLEHCVLHLTQLDALTACKLLLFACFFRKELFVASWHPGGEVPLF